MTAESGLADVVQADPRDRLQRSRGPMTAERTSLAPERCDRA